MIETPIENHLDEAIHDALISLSDEIRHDDAFFIEKEFAHKTTWSEKFPLLVTGDDPPLKNPNDPPKPILKPLPCGLKYAFLKINEICLVVISSSLHKQQEGKLLDVLRKLREAFRWPIFNLERINPLESTHYTHMEDDLGEVYLLNTIIEEVEGHLS